MIILNTHKIQFVAFLAISSLPCTTLAQQSVFDRAIPEPEEVSASLKLAQELSIRITPTAKELLMLYYAEKRIGRSVWGPSPRYPDSSYQQSKLFSNYLDTSLADQAVAYVQANRNRFRVVDDAWKGEKNFWEPTDDLLVRTRQLYPHAIEAMEIAFDLEFTQFIRRFWIDPDAQGKTCDQYYKEELEQNGDVYKQAYTDAEIAKWPVECAKEREVFGAARTELLNKYMRAPFTKVLSDIDVTTIVVHHSVD